MELIQLALSNYHNGPVNDSITLFLIYEIVHKVLSLCGRHDWQKAAQTRKTFQSNNNNVAIKYIDKNLYIL